MASLHTRATVILASLAYNARFKSMNVPLIHVKMATVRTTFSRTRAHVMMASLVSIATQRLLNAYLILAPAVVSASMVCYLTRVFAMMATLVQIVHQD